MLYGYLYSASRRRLFRGALNVTGRWKEKSSNCVGMQMIFPIAANIHTYIHTYIHTHTHTYKWQRVINTPPSGSQLDLSGLPLLFEMTIYQYLIYCDTVLYQNLQIMVGIRTGASEVYTIKLSSLDCCDIFVIGCCCWSNCSSFEAPSENGDHA